jgi:hypothetical protein
MNAEEWLVAKAKELAKQQALNVAAKLGEQPHAKEDWLTAKAKELARRQALNVAGKLGEDVQGEVVPPSSPGDGRTGSIDGKAVPEKLAVFALEVPRASPDRDSILRGLPEYGKALLKLDSTRYAYQEPAPEAPPKIEAAPAVPAPVAKKEDKTLERIITIVVGCVIVLFVLFSQHH